jgi:hypothetical protein
LGYRRLHRINVDHVPLFHNGETVELNFAPFCCVYIKRDIWDSCGGLDAGVDGHYRSERVMCDYIRQILRKKIVYTPEAVVFLYPKNRIPGHTAGMSHTRMSENA